MRKTWLIFLLLLSPTIGASANIPDQGWQALEEARTHLENGAYDQCLTVLEPLKAKFLAKGNLLGQAECWALEGDVYLYQRQYESVLEAYEKAAPLYARLEHHEKATYAYSVLGEINRILGKQRISLRYNLLSAEYARQFGNWQKVSSRYTIIGKNYTSLNQLDSAEWYFKEAIRIKEREQDLAHLPIAYEALGLFYSKVGNTAKSMEIYLKGIALAEAQKNDLMKANILRNLSHSLVDNQDFEKAESFAKTALLMTDTLELFYYKGFIYSLMGRITRGLGRRQEAETAHLAALKIFRDLDHKPDQVDEMINLGQLMLENGSLVKAEDWVEKGRNLAMEIDDNNSLLSLTLLDGKIELAQGRPEQSLDLFQQALLVSSQNENIHAQKTAWLGIGRAARQLGRDRLGYEALDAARILEDTLSARAQRAYAQQLAVQYRSAQQEEQIVSLQYENEIYDLQLAVVNRQRWALWLAVGLFFTMAILGMILYLNKQKHSHELQETNRLIERSLAEKELLLREIHHRVKNNLQVISSLLKLQSRYVKDPNAVNAINEGRARVRSMALIHQNLYQTANLTGVKVQGYFNRLIDELFATYQVGKDRVHLEKKVEDLNLDIDTIIPLGLILNELVTNALKYAFPEEQQGQLRITLHENKANNTLILEVADTGAGIADLNLIKKPETFGFRLVQALSEKLEAEVSLQNQGGTTVSIQIKDYQKAA